MKSNSQQQYFDYSIVIPCKNEQDNIGKLLDHLRRQSAYRQDVPIIIADAASTDHTLTIIEEYRTVFGMNIKVVEGGYPATGRNRGAAYANSEFVLFFDADILPADDYFVEEVLSLATERELDCVGTYIKTVDGNWKDKLFWAAHNAILSMYLVFGPFTTGMFMCFRLETFRAMGGFDERIVLGEDFDLTHRVKRSKFGVVRNFILNSNRRFVKMGYLKTIYMYTRVAFSQRYRLSDNREYFEV
jgi:glycosyltransferase involved in cell wall biosynthesis